jgi:hypothetical protein
MDMKLYIKSMKSQIFGAGEKDLIDKMKTKI